MKRLFYISCIALAMSGCIRNDLDYPVVYGGFTSFEVEGAKTVEIDKNNYVVTVDLQEGADKDHVKVKGYTLTEMSVPSKDIPEYLDLTEPFEVTLSTYQDYNWKIVGKQNIVRYVTCDKQVGDAAFNEENHTVILSVTEDQPLASITFTDMKLGPEGSEVVSTTGYESSFESTQVVSREMHFPITLDCVLQRSFDVVFKDKTTTWTMTAVQIAVTTQVKSVVPWCHKADVKAVFSGNGTASLEFKKKSESSWHTVRDAKVAGVGISATIKGLTGDTDYLVRVHEGEDISDEVAFHTDPELQIYNSNFDEWHQEGKIWFPYPENPTPGQLAWDTANRATANFVGGSNTYPDPNFVYAEGPGKNSVRMESIFAMVKFAGGNIYVGQFAKLVGLGVELHHGVPFNSKPTALHGYYCYMPTTINYADEEHNAFLGKEDTGQLQVFLADWDDQFKVFSAQKIFLDKNDPSVIGFCDFEIASTKGQWQEFTMPIEYNDFRTPKWAVVISASSYYANFYTGGVGSTLWLDELEFTYD